MTTGRFRSKTHWTPTLSLPQRAPLPTQLLWLKPPRSQPPVPRLQLSLLAGRAVLPAAAERPLEQVAKAA
jgi:hypothetical protein